MTRCNNLVLCAVMILGLTSVSSNAIPQHTVHLDRGTGLGWAGGYVGSGLTTTNLAGRTLRDLVLGHDTELTRLPWTGRQVRRWEPEPLRWAGVNAGLRLAAATDAIAARTHRPARRTTRLLTALTGGS